MVAWTLVFHILGIVFWIGGLLMTTVLLSRHVQETAPEARAALTRIEKKTMRAMADPGALLVILATGLALIGNANVLTILGWAETSIALASQRLEEVREHRGQLHRSVKALDEAVQRLERANEMLTAARAEAEEARLLLKSVPLFYLPVFGNSLAP